MNALSNREGETMTVSITGDLAPEVVSGVGNTAEVPFR
jgi:hypothetical protein